MHAMVVDDSPVTRGVLAGMLGEYGLTVHEADSAPAAFTLLCRRPDIRLVLVDWDLSTGGGYDFVRRLRDEAGPMPLRVIMVTAEAGVDEVAAAIEAGIDDYLTKPFSAQIVREKLDLLGVLAA